VNTGASENSISTIFLIIGDLSYEKWKLLVTGVVQ
jgi:hypothetical protein